MLGVLERPIDSRSPLKIGKTETMQTSPLVPMIKILAIRIRNQPGVWELSCKISTKDTVQVQTPITFQVR
jgi:hypothetical protein